ncbi:spindle assembly checkpoint component Mad1 [Polychytrium aggregatum]|uniref:spindle assembly checkpoint component Mad1 n=1 Tax=Polychytrium aggregatum TaxID=110093 RepID=UPI0022FED988|nr:spindle assembly checkpoint component Mad1 [Polychytrium aggregatum]KAI9202019.1 spindle assembly checkpoint component Mad1 [Polychytrium aggregatum]
MTSNRPLFHPYDRSGSRPLHSASTPSRTQARPGTPSLARSLHRPHQGRLEHPSTPTPVGTPLGTPGPSIFADLLTEAHTALSTPNSHSRPDVLSFSPPSRSAKSAQPSLGLLWNTPGAASTRSPSSPASASPDSAKVITQLRKELSEAESARQKSAIDAETDRGKLEIQLKEAQAQIEKLEANNRFMFERDQSSRQQHKALQEELSQCKVVHEAKINELRKQNQGLSQRLAEVVESHAEEQLDYQNEIKHLEIVIETKQAELERCRKELDKKSTDSLSSKRQKLLRPDLDSRPASVATHDVAKDSALAKQLSSQLKYIGELESKVQRLQDDLGHERSVSESVLKLKEEKCTLERQIEHLEPMRQRIGQLEVQLKKLEDEKQSWAQFLSENDQLNMDTPFQLAKALSDLRVDSALAKEELSLKLGEIAQKNLLISRLEQQLEDSRARVKKLDDLYAQEAAALKRAQLRCSLSEKENENFRELLKSYDAEESALMSGNYDSQKSQYIGQLEDLVKQYKSHVSRLDQELDARICQSGASSGIGADSGALRKTTEEVEQLEATIAKQKQLLSSLERENERLARQLDKCERDLGRGIYNTATTRVLELRNNPEHQEQAIRKATLEALQIENKNLHEQVKALSRGSGSAPAKSGSLESDSSRSTGDESLESTVKQLRQALEVKDMRMTRLKEVYALKAREYRDVVYSLLGYRLEFQEGTVKMTSIYADPSDCTFIITTSPEADGAGKAGPQPSTVSHGTIALSGGQPVQRNEVMQLMNKYVLERHSIPAFLAAVTLRSFQ